MIYLYYSNKLLYMQKVSIYKDTKSEYWLRSVPDLLLSIILIRAADHDMKFTSDLFRSCI